MLALLAAAVAAGARLAPADPAAVSRAHAASAGPSTVLPAQVVDFSPASRISSYATTDYGRRTTAKDDRTGTTSWRVVNATGNCCGNYRRRGTTRTSPTSSTSGTTSRS